MLPGLGERGLDDDVVERHRLGELGLRVVAAQLVGHPVQAAEDLAVAPGDLAGGGAQAAGHVPSPAPTTSCMKRLKKTEWRASSTCWVARKYFCSSSGAASMNGERLSVTESSPWKKRA